MSSFGKPILPEDIDDLVRHEKVSSVPDFVIDGINDLIKKYWRVGSRHCEIPVDTLESKLAELNCDREFPSEWMNFVDAFTKIGWMVTRHYPDALEYENFRPYYRFAKP
jgi:hypothetical protein